MKEYVLSLNDFNMPKVFDASSSIYILIVRIILLEPGTYQSHPEMGVGIKSRYRYGTVDDAFLSTLKNDISHQLETYLPSLASTDIVLTVNGNTLGIIIDTNDGAYVLAYNSETNVLDAAATYILDDL